jgi:hypothetical protein
VLEVEPVRPSLLAAPAQPVSAAPQVSATRASQQVSPAMRQVAAMLRSKDQIRAAILLNEILSPPLSRRRRKV